MLDSKCSEYSLGEGEGRYVGSLTASGMLVLSVEELKAMGVFSYHLVLSECPDPQIHCYQSDQAEDTYLMLMPLEVARCPQRKAHVFLQLLCLNSLSVTVPIEGPYLTDTLTLLGELRVQGEVARGRKVARVELETDCKVTYLDVVTFQGVQFKESSNEELLLMKKPNGYEYCLSHFKDHVLPAIYQSQEESIGHLLENELQ